MSRSAAPRRDSTSGTWWFVVDLPSGRDGGRTQAKRRGFRTKAEAQAALDELRVAGRHGTYVPPARQTVAEFLEADWLPVVRRELADSTWESYERNVRHHVLPHIGRHRLQALDGGSLNKLYGYLLTNGRLRGQQSSGLKPRTVRYIHTIIHAALDDAVKWSRVPTNAADHATPPSAMAARAPEMQVWSADELSSFLRLTEGDRYHLPWLFLATTGCRRGEALGLRWQDLDFELGLASIRQQVIPLTKLSGKGREARVVARTKNGDARVIELDRRTIMMLRTWRARQSEEKLLWAAATPTTG